MNCRLYIQHVSRISFFLFIFFVLKKSSQSQVITDAGAWIGGGFEKNIHGDLDFQFQQQLRLQQNVTQLRSFFSEFQFAYRFNKYFRLSTDYRLTVPEGMITHRIGLNATVRRRKKPFTYSYRLRYQAQFAKFASFENHIRNKLGIEYKINKHFSPYLSSEVFYGFNYEHHRFEKVRVSSGLEYRFKKRHLLKFFYLWQREFQVVLPKMTHIFGSNYEYTFKNRWKRKKKKKKNDEKI